MIPLETSHRRIHQTRDTAGFLGENNFPASHLLELPLTC